VGIVMFAYLLLNCSGLNFPLLRPMADLQGLLDDEYGVSLPASASVEHGNRMAAIRSIRHFDVRVNSADVVPFIERLRMAADRKGKHVIERDLRQLPQMPARPPDWWRPESLTQPHWLDVMPVGHGGGLWVFYSDQDGRVLLVRYSM
jgi:hypothetical protein